MFKKLYAKSYQLFIWLRFKLFQHHRMYNLVIEYVDGLPLLILPDVFNPNLIIVCEMFARAVKEEPGLEGVRVLDVGTGSGLLGIFAAKRGASVVALDLNPHAVRCTQINALLNEVSIDVRQSDLFDAVAGETFDVILFNPPFFVGKPKSYLDMAFFSEGAIDRFIVRLVEHLAPGGKCLIGVSDTKHMDGFYDSLKEQGFTWQVLSERRLPSETYSIVRASQVSGA